MSLEDDLERARERLAAAEVQANNLRAKAEALTPGGFRGDSAVLSGIRRKPNPRKTAARFNAYDREAAAAAQIPALEQKVRLIEKAIVERDRVRFTRAEVEGATHVRTRVGWAKIRRLNAKTVSVDSGYSWADLIRYDDILDVRRLSS